MRKLILTFLFIAVFTNNGTTTIGSDILYILVTETVELTDDRLVGTYYHAVKGQTDTSPLNTSDGSHITYGLEDALRWCALSRDLLNVPSRACKDTTGTQWRGDYKYGDTLIVSISECTRGLYSEKIVGKWIVHDCMNKRFTNTIDFLVSTDYLNGGKWIDLKVSKIETHQYSISYM